MTDFQIHSSKVKLQIKGNHLDFDLYFNQRLASVGIVKY